MECRVLESKKCAITQGANNTNHIALDLVKEGYMLDYIVAHSEGTIIALQDGLGNMKGTNSYGNYVKIDHGNGYCTLYAHMQKGLPVKNGQFVKKGQRLGYMSDSGNAYGGHLHWEVWKNGSRINPTEYLNKDFVSGSQSGSQGGLQTLDEVAKDVLEGKYGNYPERKTRLEAAGYNYSEVQARVNQLVKGNSIKYLHNPNYKGTSIVDALNQIGVDSSFSNRSKLAQNNSITNYRGTAEQNTKMLEMLKNGTLKSV